MKNSRQASPITRLSGFPAFAFSDARILILGSMPGGASLAAGEYYAHLQNSFWPIMGALVGAGPDLPYTARLEKLREARIALWDVIATCRRIGSLDTAIEEEVPNDFADLFRRCPHITGIFFNGAKAEASFRRYVLPTLDAARFTLTRLPSTSPAHAGRSRTEKIAAWRVILKTFAAPASGS